MRQLCQVKDVCKQLEIWAAHLEAAGSMGRRQRKTTNK